MSLHSLLATAGIAMCTLAACQEDAPESIPSNAIPDVARGSQSVVNMALDYVATSAYTEVEGAVEGGVCALDAINGRGEREVTLGRGAGVLFSGWVGDAKRRVPASPVLVFRGEGSSHAVTFSANGSRPDVASVLGSKALANSGFNVSVRIGGLPPGRYELVVLTEPRTGTYCDLRATVGIAP
ncbi:hypothetical protein [Luteimonas changyuni]|uniref:hypothetical protein n=1 Tax=Luteimonas sp. MJ145 TaxID=3129234 RepID=UPI0031B9EC08